MTNAEARALLQDASQDFPEQFGIEMKVEKGSRELMSATGSFDNATETIFMQFTIDPEAFNDTSAGEDGATPESVQAMFAGGFTVYGNRDGVIWLVNNTAYSFPASPEEGGEDDAAAPGGFEPTPEETPFGDFFAPEDFAEAFGESDANVTSVTPVVYRNQPAVRIVATGIDEEGRAQEGTLIVFTSSKRIAHMEADLPVDEENPTDPFGGGFATIDFYYEGELDVQVPEAAQRALGLAYKSDANPFSFGGDSGPTTWTFQVNSSIALSEIEIQVKGEPVDTGNESGETPMPEEDFDGDGDIDEDDAALAEEYGYYDYEDTGSSSEEMPNLADLPTLWSMKLSEGTKTQDGMTVTFEDVDGDEKVSHGDTLTITYPEDGTRPTVVLHDTLTGTYVVPGPAFALLLAGLGVVALALRRRV